jgi:hypothetical protein
MHANDLTPLTAFSNDIIVVQRSNLRSNLDYISISLYVSIKNHGRAENQSQRGSVFRQVALFVVALHLQSEPPRLQSEPQHLQTEPLCLLIFSEMKIMAGQKTGDTVGHKTHSTSKMTAHRSDSTVSPFRDF